MGVGNSTQIDFNKLFIDSKKLNNKVIRNKLLVNFKKFGNRPVFFITKKNDNEFIIHKCDGLSYIENKKNVDKLICNYQLEIQTKSSFSNNNFLDKVLKKRDYEERNNFLNKVIEGYEYIDL